MPTLSFREKFLCRIALYNSLLAAGSLMRGREICGRGIQPWIAVRAHGATMARARIALPRRAGIDRRGRYDGGAREAEAEATPPPPSSRVLPEKASSPERSGRPPRNLAIVATSATPGDRPADHTSNRDCFPLFTDNTILGHRLSIPPATPHRVARPLLHSSITPIYTRREPNSAALLP